MHRLLSVALLSTALIIASVAPSSSWASVTTAPPTQEMQVHLIDEGIYKTLGDAESIAAPQTAAGKIGEHGGLRLLVATNSPAAKKGVTFGFRFFLRAPLNGSISGFEMRAIHPPMRGVDGKTHTSQTAPINIDFEKGVAYHDVVYVLSEDFEVLPGEWTLEIRYQGRPLIARKFNLVSQ